MSVTIESSPVEPTPSPSEVTPQTPWSTPKRKRAQDWLYLMGLAIVSAGITLFTGVAGVDGWAFVFFLGYFTSDMRVTGPDDDLNFGGVGHAIIGSLIMVLIATLVTLPLGILSGMYLSEIRGRFSFLVRFVVQSMSGVPSIVAGLFIYATIVIPMGKYSGLAGSAALAVLMLPTIARTSEEVLKLVPDDLRTAGYALGSRQWRTAIMIVLPTVRSGLVTAAILGVARVIGETAPLILTSLYASNFQFNPVEGPIAALPTYVFGLLKLGTEYAIARAWAGSLVLMLVVAILFALARFIGNKGPRA